MEQQYVTSFYNNNVKSFHDTRYAPWPFVKTFIDNLPQNSTVCDIGCGNGKNQYRKDLNYISCDSSIEMCKLVQNCVLCDCTDLPFENNCCDVVLCIAVIHHLSSNERRLQALHEIKRVLKSNGKALISVWGSQPKYGSGDQIIGWNHNLNQRYIHFFENNEIIHLVSQVFENFHITEDYNNFFIVI